MYLYLGRFDLPFPHKEANKSLLRTDNCQVIACSMALTRTFTPQAKAIERKTKRITRITWTLNSTSTPIAPATLSMPLKTVCVDFADDKIDRIGYNHNKKKAKN